MPHDQFRSAVVDYIMAIEGIARRFGASTRRLYWSGAASKMNIKTVTSNNSAILPATQRPIRGYSGTELITEVASTTVEEIVESWLGDIHGHSASLESGQAEYAAVVKAGRTLADMFQANEKLYYLLVNSISKRWSLEEFRTFRDSHSTLGLLALLRLDHYIAKELVKFGFDPNSPGEFDGWCPAAHRVVDIILGQLEAWIHYYEVMVFLNGPLIDSVGDVPIADLKFVNREVSVSVLIGYATDERLNALAIRQDGQSLDNINTVLRYEIALPVDGSQASYQAEFDYAATIADLILTGLRLSRPVDDLGIMAIKILPLSPLASTIEDAYHRHHSDWAVFQPRRFSFAPPSSRPMLENELAEIKKFIANYLQDKPPVRPELKLSIRRFENSIERYDREDPERILEWAIALEALYLNDPKVREELSYRLRIRAARFLKKELEDRKKISKVIRDLYDLRSMLAHGSDFTALKDKDQKKLKDVLQMIPKILADSILSQLARDRESGSKEIDPEFWAELELA